MKKTNIRKPKRDTRAPLGAERIARAALDLIDRESLDGFSFRVLARELGCEAMSLYHYYPSKAHLFDALAEIYLSEIPAPPEDVSWIDQIRHICRSLRSAALRHPGFFQFMAVYRMNSRAGLAYLDGIVRVMEKSGLNPEMRARLFRVMGYYLTGAALDEALGYAKGPSAAEPVQTEDAKRDFPAIMGIGQWFSAEHHAKTFELGIEIILARFIDEAEKSGHARTGTV
jgi:AcrR family transcriptional regulator